MSPDALFAELEARFDALKVTLNLLDAEAEANIVRWRYSVESAFELQADFYRRFNETPGTLLDDEPSEAYTFYAYGYDAQERIIYAALFQSEAEPRLCSFYSYGENVIEVAEFGIELYVGRYHLGKVGRLRLGMDERLQDYTACVAGEGRANFLFEGYHYDERGRLARVVMINQARPRPLSAEAQSRWDHALDQQRQMAKMLGTEEQWSAQFEPMVNQAVFQATNYRTETIYQYDGDTLKSIITEDPDRLNPRVVYEPPREGETDEQVRKAARASLRVEVLHQILQIDVETRQETRWCNLEVYFDAVAGDSMLLTLVPEVVQQEWERVTLERSYRSFVWEIGADKRFIQVSFSPPREYERFIQRARLDDKWDEIRMVVYAAARDLNTENWDGLLNVTDDFIVFGNDYLTEDPHEEIRASVPEDKLRILRAKGLIE